MVEHIKRYGRTTFASFAIRNYRLYFLGQSISAAGTWMQTVALSWLILEITGSGLQLGLILACQFLPILLFGLWGGVVVDRFDTRRLLYITQTSFALLSLGMGALVLLNAATVGVVYAFSALFGLINAVDNPARQAFISEMVGKEHVKNAVTLNSVMVNLARIVGPAAAGFFIASAGIAACFFVNALTFVFVPAMLSLMRREELIPAEPVERAKGQLREGLRYALAAPELRSVLALVLLVGTLAFEFRVSLPLFASGTFDTGALGYAVLFSAMGVGAIVGGLSAAGRQGLTHRNLMLATFFFGFFLVADSLMPTLALAALFMVPVGFFSINMTSTANSILQLHSAPPMRGRVMSLWTMGMLGSTPVGAPIIGFVGQYAGPRWGLVVGGVAAIAAAFLLRSSLSANAGSRAPAASVR